MVHTVDSRQLPKQETDAFFCEASENDSPVEPRLSAARRPWGGNLWGCRLLAKRPLSAVFFKRT